MRDARSLELSGVRWWLRAGAGADAWAPLLARALAQLPSATDLRSGRRKRLYRLALGGEPANDHLLKRSGYPFARGWLRRAGGSKARRELVLAQALAARGVAVVVPVAAGERRRHGRVIECFLLAPLLADARDLRALWRDPAQSARERRRLMRSLGELIRSAHAAGLHQHDLAPNNVLVCGGESGRLRLIDFERARLRARASEGARRRMLAKLARAAVALPATQRLRFLHAYAGDRSSARRWWTQLREEAPRLARRDDTRMRRSATRDGRGFERIAHAGWHGYARRGAAFEAALAALPPGPAASGGAVRVARAGETWRVLDRRRNDRDARRLWARANTLAARGLAPAPLAIRLDRERTLLIFEANADMRSLTGASGDVAARRALARLLAELGALGELADPLESGMFVLVSGSAGRQRALLVVPQVFSFSGSAGGPRSCAAAARLLRRLDARDEPTVQFAP